MSSEQCCGSGSGMSKKSGFGSGIRMSNPDHISESLQTIFWVKILKILCCGSRIRDGKNSDPGWKKIRIRNKHPGSATLARNLPYGGEERWWWNAEPPAEWRGAGERGRAASHPPPPSTPSPSSSSSSGSTNWTRVARRLRGAKLTDGSRNTVSSCTH